LWIRPNPLAGRLRRSPADLLRNEAQAIMTGKIGEDGVFYAEELLLKCPTKYEESVPEQAEG
jgi:cytochrome c-type biogenesis protein CcmE